ncbi:MAG: hypothetical protein JNK05_19555 [Myxococcales bacterium]|nr:hypothetical protein [Myxococcales bacterium]
MEEPRSEAEQEGAERTSRLLGAGAMTALSLAYPLMSGWYFWHDWFKYFGRDTPLTVGMPGVSVPVNELLITWLSPWRVILAMITAKLLFTSAKKLRQGASDAKALSMLTLFGVLAPQIVWYFEFANDWNAGQGFGSIAMLFAAATMIPALLLAKGKGALAGWGKLADENKPRVMAGAVGLGWLAMAAMSLVDHSFQLLDGMKTFAAATAVLPLAALAMLGLYRQKTWGMLAGGATVAAAGASAVALSDTSIQATGTTMDLAFGTVANSPVTAAAIPAVIFALLMRPFLSGAAKKVAGVEERETGIRVDASASAANVDESESPLNSGAESRRRAG